MASMGTTRLSKDVYLYKDYEIEVDRMSLYLI